MNAKLFTEKVKSLLPELEVVEEYKHENIQIDENWEMRTTWWGRESAFAPAMIQVLMIYRFPRTKTNRKTRKDFAGWCYKYKHTEWKIAEIDRL